MLVYNNNRPEKLFNKLKEDNIVQESSFKGLQKIVLTVDGKAYQKLKTKRDEAIKQSILFSSNEDYVKAKINFDNKEAKAEIRLKGDWTDHLKGDKWSFRVKLPSDNAILGMRKFSLHRPETRNYAAEWLFHQLLRENDVLNLQYHFVEVELEIEKENATERKNLGLYALEESFDKHLLERSERRESVILKLDENPMWEERALFMSKYFSPEQVKNFTNVKNENLKVVPFNEKKVLEDPLLFSQFQTGRALFKSFMLGERPVHEVFDIKLLAKYNAISNLMGASHGLNPHNYRVYYNPISSLLEPIGFDGDSGKPIYTLDKYHNASRDLVYLEEYAKALTEISDDDYFGKYVKRYPGLKEVVEVIQREYKNYTFPEKVLQTNKNIIKKILSPNKSINAYFENVTKGMLELTVENYGKLPTEIYGIKQSGGRYFATPEERIICPIGKTTFSLKLVKGYEQIFTNVKKKKVGFDPKKDIPKALVVYSTLGNPDRKESQIQTWAQKYDVNLALPNYKDAGTISEFDWLQIDEENKTITIPKGKHTITDRLIVPPGYQLIVEAGTSINLKENSASIISYSPFKFIGTEAKPIKFYCETYSGEGIILMNAQDTSYLEYCHFDNLGSPKRYAWQMTGSVSFYQSPVSIKHSSFKNNRCEDALNVIRAYAELDDLVFENIYSDAFDGDFMHGTIKNCMFGKIGNDAIDVSGSKISIDNTNVYNAGDKGLSAGENTQMTATNVLIKDCEIAIASKDKSVLELNESILTNNKLNFTAFQKKPEYGSASIITSNVKTEFEETNYLIENGSSLLLNGQEMPTIEGVKDKMYGVEFGKKSN
jgi:hypothetical protein